VCVCVCVWGGGCVILIMRLYDLNIHGSLCIYFCHLYKSYLVIVSTIFLCLPPYMYINIADDKEHPVEFMKQQNNRLQHI
jgi:hypothetical protein